MEQHNSNLVDDIFDALELAKRAYALLPPLPPDIKPVHLRILHSVYRTRDAGGNTRITDISKDMGILLPNATKLIQELAALGTVEKFNSPSDKRVVLVHTTELGEEYIRRYVLNYHILLQQAFSELGESDCSTMIETIHKVYQAMKKVYQGENGKELTGNDQ